MEHLKNKYLFFILFCCFVSGIFCDNKIYQPISFSKSFVLGYDSNPLRLSYNEILELPDRPYLLADATSIFSRFIGFNGKFKFYSKKTPLSFLFDNRKTIFSLGYTYKFYSDNEEKSRQSFSFKVDQQLGNYKHLYIDYFLMPNYYLREYEDIDLQVINNDIESSYYSCSFDNEKLGISYQHPLIEKKSKVKLGIFYEKQLFNEHFTEYDLKIHGEFIQFYFSRKNHSFYIYIDSQNANNYTYLDGNYSTRFMDRGYKQNRLKFSFTQIINKEVSLGTIMDIYKRKNLSMITDDELHYDRKHKDATLSFWYKYKKHKIILSSRNRISSSPFTWVAELKTFKRYILTYTYSFDTIRYN